MRIRHRFCFARHLNWNRLGILIALAGIVSLVSCSDDSDCSSPYYAEVTARLDSARYLVQTKDSLLRGAVAGSEEKRVRHSLGESMGSWNLWESKPRVRSYVTDLVGTLVVGGRLGLIDTLVFYEVDSVGVLPGDGRSAAVRLEFRSVLGDAPPYYDSYATSRIGDSATIHWNLHGKVECSLPLETPLDDQTAFSCKLDATGERNTAVHLEIKVVKYRYEYECSNGNSIP